MIVTSECDNQNRRLAGRTEFQMRMYECLYVTMGGEPMTHTLSRTRLQSANEVNS